jgi:hypothetical protein
VLESCGDFERRGGREVVERDTAFIYLAINQLNAAYTFHNDNNVMGVL